MCNLEIHTVRYTNYLGYKVFTDGTVLSKCGKVLKGYVSTSKWGRKHLMYDLYHKGVRKKWQAHRLVWYCFKGEIPRGKVVDHIDNNSLNNDLDNLQLLTPTENTRKGVGKVTLAKAQEIRSRLNLGEVGSDLAREFGIDRSQITRIKKGETWKTGC